MKGFTLVEIVVVLGILSVLLAVGAPLYRTSEQQASLQASTTTLAEVLRKAQVYAQSGKEDAEWGVRTANSGITLFKGQSYASREPAFDETYPLTRVTVSGVTDVYFSKMLGLPSATGTTTFAIGSLPPRNLNLNAQGTITY